MKQLFHRLNSRRKRQRKDKATVVGQSSGTSDAELETTTAKKAEARPTVTNAPVQIVAFVPEELEQQQRVPPTYHDGDDYSDGYHRYSDDGQEKDESESNHPDEVVRIALHASQKALPVATKGSKPNISCETLDKTAGECFEKGKIDDAVNKYEDALLLKRQTLLGQYNALKLSDASEEEKSKVLASMATSINNLAYLRQVKGEASSAETLQSYEIALSIKKEILGSKHLSVGKTLNNIGSVHYMQRNFYAAAENYEEARDILRAQLGEDSLDVSTVSSNLGDVHYCLKQWKRASEEYRTALGLRWKLLGAKDPKVVRLMEQIAEVEFKMTDFHQAEVEDCGSDQGTFAAEVDQLHTELDLDIEFFDSLQREAPMTLIRDKAEVFKELRELSGDAPKTPKEESPVQCNTEKWTNAPQVLSESSSSPKRSSTKCESPPSPTLVHIPVAVGVRVMDQEVPRPALRVSTSRTPTTPVTVKRRTSIRTPPSTSSSSSHYTPVERKEALNSVRERLARLRKEREKKFPTTPSKLDAQQLQELTHSSSKLLKASELLTIQQGLNSLRDASQNHDNDSPRTDGNNEAVSTKRLGRLRGSHEPAPAYFLRP